jgi:S-adenosylmethionine:tRNA ribosyltransferase-isomerase
VSGVAGVAVVSFVAEEHEVELRVDDFDFELPPELIAQTPVEPRDSSRLLVIHRATGTLEHRIFRDIVEYLRPGDLLIANDSRVLPGRLQARKPTGGRVELLLLRDLGDGWWEALARPAHRLRPGQRLTLERPAPESAQARPGASPGAVGSLRSAGDGPGEGPEIGASRLDPQGSSAPPQPADAPPAPADAGPGPQELEVGERTASGGVRVRFGAPVEEVVARYGTVPLPPYIRTPLADPERYQTVYARVSGSAAAPTAGLHFTSQLLETLARKGVQFGFVTLHVGPDTFQPVRVRRIVEHKMHSEFVAVPETAARAIVAAKREGRRVIAVGTTAVRAVESWAAVVAGRPDWELVAEGAAGRPGQPDWLDQPDGPDGPDRPDQFEQLDRLDRLDWQRMAGDRPLGWSGWTRLFIYPGYRFLAVDALITNFHLPRSTLLMLVSAFAGIDLVRRAYAEAMARRYRFYSFGDCCLFL